MAMFAIMALTKKRRGDGTAGSHGNLFEVSGDTPEDDDPTG